MIGGVVVSLPEHRVTLGPNRVGLVLGVVLGGMHLVWALLVAAGVAQDLMDFIFRLHFIRPVYFVEAFDPLRALGLVVLSAASGYCIGAVFALFWNRMRR
jgi:hypothetical protein